MKNLKCVGGICDGVIWQVEDYNKIHDYIKVRDPEPLKFEVSNFEEDLKAYREGRTPESMTTKYHLYKICAIHGTSKQGDKLTLEYLCPTGWHEWEAIQHQFNK